jgi:hypothetical protein
LESECLYVKGDFIVVKNVADVEKSGVRRHVSGDARYQ